MEMLWPSQGMMSMLSKVWKSDDFESHDNLKVNFTNISGFCSNIAEYESFNETHLTFLLYVRQTWMTELILAISLWEVIFH